MAAWHKSPWVSESTGKSYRVEIDQRESGMLVAESPDRAGFIALSTDPAVLDQVIDEHMRDLDLADDLQLRGEL